MKKLRTKMIYGLLCGAFLLSGAAVSRAHFSANTNRAVAQTAPPVLSSTQPTALLNPTTYEEYLHLQTPADVAVSGNYTAIADGEQVHLYNRVENAYFTYTHEDSVTKLQFTGADGLFFLDENMRLFSLTPQNVTGDSTYRAENIPLPCTNFFVQGDEFYYTAESGGKAKVCKTETANPGNKVTPLVEEIAPGPTIVYYQDDLYYTSGRELWMYDTQYGDAKYLATFPHLSKISAMSILNDTILICAATEEMVDKNAQNLFAYSLNELIDKSNADKTTLLETDDEGGYTALSVYDEYIYAVKKDCIRQYSTTQKQFTSFEICSRSNSVHRLDGAKELCLIGDTLLIADNGNERIGVYNVKNGEYLPPIPSAISAKYLVSDGKTVLTANENTAVLYSLSNEEYGARIATFTGFDSDLVGVAAVYGKYYFTTTDYRYVAQNSQTGWTLSDPVKGNISATLLTADAYGYLYVAGGGGVYKYTEEQFFLDGTREKIADSYPVGMQKLAIDYAGNAYGLHDGQLFPLGETAYALNTPLVYVQDANIISFAFGIEENITYLLYEENYLAQTTILQLPTVKNIAVNGADESVFAQEDAVFQIVKSKPNTLIVRFDLQRLSGAELYPYTSYERREQPFLALKIGQSQGYNLLAVYDEEKQEYFTCLALTDFCENADEYYNEYQTPTTGYLSNDVYLYKFPYLTNLLTVDRLTADMQVVLLGEIEELDYAYYQVEYTQDGVTRIGYIPKNFVTEYSGNTAVKDILHIGEDIDGMDLLFRYLYIILGVGVICILADILILRKPKKDDDAQE